MTKKSGPKRTSGNHKAITVSVVLSAETVDMLNHMARAQGVSRSSILRGLVRNEFIVWKRAKRE